MKAIVSTKFRRPEVVPVKRLISQSHRIWTQTVVPAYLRLDRLKSNRTGDGSEFWDTPSLIGSG